ncbi:family 16 glycosylhydrolase [Cellvibrio sp. NN19]|uniref:family 16 glycosylhydrolase n=1 Tax=Cellvibrio chitinivorans TaxID=3102792 RepID=UPI002B415A16|nr:family 16 glycosylhydrolase [Cellvibrio sp. NN19]
MKYQQLGFTPVLSKICVALTVVGLAGCGGSDGGGQSSSAASLSSSSVISSSSVAVSSSEASSAIAESSSSTETSSSSSSTPQWELVWSDEFDGTAIDTDKWSHEKNCWGGGNNEQQCYTDRAVNSYVGDGVLTIVAQREDFTGSDNAEGEGSGTKTLPYTSARLRTKNIAEWTFGRFEIRAKLPAGQGTWPAIWMLPTDSPYGVWAASGEIDIMEAVNLKVVTDGSAPEARVHGTLHYGRVWPGNVNAGAAYTLPDNANPADDFHTYAVEWEEGEIRWYVDDVHFATQTQAGWYGQYLQGDELVNAPEGAPFDRHSKFHMLLNLAVGGNWAGTVNNTGVDESAFPQKMEVDFVRVYQCSGSPVDGKGCATFNEDPEQNVEQVPGHRRPGIGKVNFSGPPLLLMYGDEVTEGLFVNSYNPDKFVTFSEVAEEGRGNVLNIVKTGASGNAYLQVDGDPTDLTGWSGDSELIFDVKVNSKADGAKLLVKIDSGWPNVSDVEVAVAELGVWEEFRISLADLKDNGNSMNGGNGRANLASITNTFVVDSTGAIDVSFDNIRIEGEASTGVDVFAPLPSYSVFDDVIGSGLDIQVYTPANVTTSTVAEEGHGNVFKVVKTGGAGNVSFHVIDAPVSLNHWVASGELKFDFKVNSKAADSTLLIKMDTGWPQLSDVNVPLPADGTWGSFSISVADLIARRNSIDPAGIVNINSITNLFVIEPSGAMDVVFDNVRLVEKP